MFFSHTRTRNSQSEAFKKRMAEIQKKKKEAEERRKRKEAEAKAEAARRKAERAEREAQFRKQREDEEVSGAAMFSLTAYPISPLNPRAP